MGILKLFIFTIFLTSNSFAKTIEKKFFDETKPIHQKITSKENYKLLYYWASWCPDCKEKLNGPLIEFRKNKKLDILTVNVDKKLDRAKHFIEKQNLDFPVIRDEEKTLRKKFKVFAVPSWTLLKKKGEQWIEVESKTGSDLSAIELAMKK